MRQYSIAIIISGSLMLSSAFVYDRTSLPRSRTSIVSSLHDERKILLLLEDKLVQGQKSLQLRKRTSIFLLNKEQTEIAENFNDSENKLKLLKDDIEEKSRSYDNMGFLMPIAERLDAVTGDWALSYADLSPATPKTPAGISFLLTNVLYAIAGILLITQGDLFYGGLVEVAGAVSFWYHYSQLELGINRSEVRLALLTDYFTAGSALITGGIYMVDIGVTSVPMDAFIVGGSAIVALSLCWVWEFGYPYLILHSIWHILSAYTGYLIGQAHIEYVS